MIISNGIAFLRYFVWNISPNSAKSNKREISKPSCTPEGLKALFEQFGGREGIVAQKLQDEEFDCLYYFKSGEPDRYRYCVTFEEHHAAYHRFLPLDYADFGFKEGKTF